MFRRKSIIILPMKKRRMGERAFLNFVFIGKKTLLHYLTVYNFHIIYISSKSAIAKRLFLKNLCTLSINWQRSYNYFSQLLFVVEQWVCCPLIPQGKWSMFSHSVPPTLPPQETKTSALPVPQTVARKWVQFPHLQYYKAVVFKPLPFRKHFQISQSTLELFHFFLLNPSMLQTILSYILHWVVSQCLAASRRLGLGGDWGQQRLGRSNIANLEVTSLHQHNILEFTGHSVVLSVSSKH